ncbi:isocitrate lyase/phosphoenolpyruvate mutase family protein [Silanimonas sp.]|jgi:2-methylisocitrate lyase-like PEP mutase family enzyme|uniref:isocitrate lyase/PEP mutase family protein n=1 Tax=Silanimonas sp. TaxID=1929290 RepID=UPI0022BB2049|nr:isocitrate lyase/phosphoenolpyruvate mutase family protein [Silanimonas sp.]MCZ8061940.1 isocitrate lyase/phosphoenolpyruvate mutase family protein [Silanimonas sp.]
MTTPSFASVILNKPGLLCIPNAWDAASARRVVSAGAPLIATTSAGVSWSLGLSDGEALTPPQVVQRALEIRRVCPATPLSVDIERGYSNSPRDVVELVDALVAAGVSSINIEDGDETAAVLASKIAAIRSRHDRRTLFVNARTDVYLLGLAAHESRASEAISRASIYVDAGCDGVFVPGVIDIGEIDAIAKSVAAPLNVMALPGLPTVDELERLGVRRLTAGPALAIATYGRCEQLAGEFMSGQMGGVWAAPIDFAGMNT